MSETKYLKITANCNYDYDGNCDSPAVEVQEIDSHLIFEDEKALQEHCKGLGWIKDNSEEFKKYLKQNGYRYTPVATIEAREGAKIKHLYFSSDNKPPTYIWDYDSSRMMNNALTEDYRWKQLVAGKVKIYAEIDPMSLMTEKEQEKFKADKAALKEKKAKQSEAKKKKKLEQAKKLVALLEHQPG